MLRYICCRTLDGHALIESTFIGLMHQTQPLLLNSLMIAQIAGLLTKSIALFYSICCASLTLRRLGVVSAVLLP